MVLYPVALHAALLFWSEKHWACPLQWELSVPPGVKGKLSSWAWKIMRGLGAAHLGRWWCRWKANKGRRVIRKRKAVLVQAGFFFFFANFWMEKKLCRKTEARCCLHSGYNYKYLRSVEMFPLLGWKAQCTSSVCCSKTDPISWCSSTADLLFYCYLAH